MTALVTGRRLNWLMRGISLAAFVTAYYSAPLDADPVGAQTLPAAVRAQVEAGKQLFVTACANCHGSAGKGAIGPALAERDLSQELIRNTFLNGRVGTPMPPFKDELDPKSQAEIIAYVQWLTSAGRLPDAVISIQGGAGTALASPSSEPAAVGREKGIPAHGAALFFDPTKLYSCRACHSYGNKGGPVGPDLINLDKAAVAIYQSITRAKMKASGFPPIAIELRDGTRLLGIKSDETDDVIRLFDVSSLPPVKRSVLKSDIYKVSAIENSGIYDHTALPFSKQDWLDLSAYLGKLDSPASSVDTSALAH
jgi:putative heme-binding domain-containing protein